MTPGSYKLSDPWFLCYDAIHGFLQHVALPQQSGVIGESQGMGPRKNNRAGVRAGPVFLSKQP